MKLLLTAINAKYIHSNLAVYSLRASSGEAKEHVALAEYTINQLPDQILMDLYRRQPDVLFFSVYIWNLSHVEEIAAEFHKLCPSVPIWVGGPEVSYKTKSFLDNHPWATGIMIGEGEETFRELASYYLNTSDPALRDRSACAASDSALFALPGLVLRRDGAIFYTPACKPLDMSSLPFAYEDLEDFEHRIIYYESSRGCPFSCSYCLSSVDKHLRFRNTELVKKELQFFLDRKVPQIKFVDRTFNCAHRHAMEIWQYIADHDNGVTNFHFEISADLIRQEELDLIAAMRPGLIQLEIGVQSTNPHTITEIHRTMDLDRLKEVVRSIQSHGNIHQHLDLIAGLPFEDFDSFARSFDEIYALKPNQLQMGFLKVLKGSYMYEHAREYDCIYHTKPPYEVLSTKWLSYDDILKLKLVEEMLEVHYNSGQFEITVKLLECLFDSAFSMYLALGTYYLEKGYLDRKHTRLGRCQILLDFLRDRRTNFEEQRPDLIQLFEESLTFDLYYRENCKTRPKWAPDPAGFKQLTREFCPKGMPRHLELFHYRFPAAEERTIMTLPAYTEAPICIRFSYDRRDPLNHQAFTEEVTPKIDCGIIDA